jgi:hypothetical protein
MSDQQGLSSLPVPYEVIALLLEQRRITLFLGAAASIVNGVPSQLVDGRDLTLELIRLSNYPGKDSDPLTKVAQYLVEYAGDRDFILEYIKNRFHDKIPENYRCSVTDFLSDIPAQYIPKLIISTNYDTLIERLLERRGLPYLCISHVLGRSKFSGRLVIYEKLGGFSTSNILTKKDAEELLFDRLSEGRQFTVVYKMHGSATSYLDRNDRDESFPGGFNSIVLTEQDYIDFLDRNTINQLPTQIQKMVYQSQFLFLGYSLGDWNFRLLLQRLRENQSGADTKHWACLLSDDPVESVFWQKRGVNIHYVSLDRFLADLKQKLAGGHG